MHYASVCSFLQLISERNSSSPPPFCVPLALRVSGSWAWLLSRIPLAAKICKASQPIPELLNWGVPGWDSGNPHKKKKLLRCLWFEKGLRNPIILPACAPGQVTYPLCDSTANRESQWFYLWGWGEYKKKVENPDFMEHIWVGNTVIEGNASPRDFYLRTAPQIGIPLSRLWWWFLRLL